MAEKDINADAKTEAQESPAVAVAIDGYEEVARGGSKFWDKMKYHLMRTAVVVTAAAASFGASKINVNDREYKIGMMLAPLIVGLAVASSIKRDKKDDGKTANFTEYTGRS